MKRRPFSLLLLLLLVLVVGPSAAAPLPSAAKAKCGVADLRDGATLDTPATDRRGASVKYIKSIVVAGENKKLACAQACCDESECDLGIYELVQDATRGGKFTPNNCFLLSCQPFGRCVFKNTTDMNTLAIVNRKPIVPEEEANSGQEKSSSPVTTGSSGGTAEQQELMKAHGDAAVSFMPSGRATSGLVAALFFGCAFTLVVAALSCRVLCEAWSRRHYSKLRYLDNGGNGF